MADPLTYPPEIVIESKVAMPPEFWRENGDDGIDLAVVLTEIVLELLSGP